MSQVIHFASRRRTGDSKGVLSWKERNHLDGLMTTRHLDLVHDHSCPLDPHERGPGLVLVTVLDTPSSWSLRTPTSNTEFLAESGVGSDYDVKLVAEPCPVIDWPICLRDVSFVLRQFLLNHWPGAFPLPLSLPLCKCLDEIFLILLFVIVIDPFHLLFEWLLLGSPLDLFLFLRLNCFAVQWSKGNLFANLRPTIEDEYTEGRGMLFDFLDPLRK